MAIKKIFNANIETVPIMMDFVEGLIKDLPEKAAYDMRLSCEEILVNIASYAYDGDGELTIAWEDNKGCRQITAVFEDMGIPFDPLQKKDVNLNVPLRERGIGGLGIMMVRKLMDEVQYAYVDGKNRLTIVKEY